MDRFDYMITKEHYDALKGKTHAEIWSYCNNEATSPLNATILYGYGLYGVGAPFERDGKYYINIETGSTCD